MSPGSEVGSERGSDDTYRSSFSDPSEETFIDCSRGQAPVVGTEPGRHKQGHERRESIGSLHEADVSHSRRSPRSLATAAARSTSEAWTESMPAGRQGKPARASHPGEPGRGCRVAGRDQSNHPRARVED